MRASHYNLFFPFGEKYILYNALRESKSVLDSEFKDVLEGDISSLDEKYVGLLRDNGIVVDDEIEKDSVKLFFNISRYDATVYSHIITTYRCNLSCTYCHEKGREFEKSMDEKTASCVTQFIKDVASSNSSSKMVVELLGGEPLSAMPANRVIITDLSRWCEETGTELSLTIVTNGTLLTPDTVEELAVSKCGFLITLDGPRDIHDERRRYMNGEGTFNDAVVGLSRVLDSHLDAVVHINVDEANRDHVVSLLEFLKDNALTPKISIKPVVRSFPCRWHRYCVADKGRTQPLFDAARNMNFTIHQLEKPPLKACFAQKLSYFAVDPFLRLYRCAVLPPASEHSVGVIREKDCTPDFNPMNIDFLSRDPTLFDACTECNLLPVCLGGCPAQALQTAGTTHQRVCNRDDFTEMLKTYFVNSMRQR